MKSAVMFSRATDEWSTPQDFFNRLHGEFEFTVDAAASTYNHKCAEWYGPQHPRVENRNALVSWDWPNGPVWLNPPYSQCRAFIAKAALEARRGATVVCLVPSRTDTRWWHSEVWDGSKNAFRPGVEVRFLPGRLKFGGSKNSAPFPSCVIVFRPTPESAMNGDAVARAEGISTSGPRA